MQLDRQFAAEAARGAVVMLIVPLVVVGALNRLLGGQPGWQDILRASVWLLFLYVVVMVRRYRQRGGSPLR